MHSSLPPHQPSLRPPPSYPTLPAPAPDFPGLFVWEFLRTLLPRKDVADRDGSLRVGVVQERIVDLDRRQLVPFDGHVGPELGVGVEPPVDLKP